MFAMFFGDYLVEKNIITTDQLDQIIKLQETSRVKLGFIAVAEKMLNPQQAEEINMFQARMDKRFGDIAIDKGYLMEEQVNKLLSLQGNPYLQFIQTITELNILTMEELNKYLADYQLENGFSNEDIEALKTGDLDRIVPLFVKIDEPFYNDYVALALRNILRFVSRNFSFGKITKVNTYKKAHLASQTLEGQHHLFVAFASDNNELINIANPFAKENFTTVDEDVYDAVCEFINCINGLFASKLSISDIEIDMLPPVFYENKTIDTNDSIYVLPLNIEDKSIDLVITIDSTYEIN